VWLWLQVRQRLWRVRLIHYFPLILDSFDAFFFKKMILLTCRCKMYPDMSSSETITNETLVLGVAPEKGHFAGAAETVVGAENGCKCGANCTCDPCTCK
jgi:hypothetical protein